MDLTLFTPIIGAMVYAIVGLVRSIPAGDDISAPKFIVTIIVGAAAGYVMMMNGITVTDASFTAEMANNSALYLAVTYVANKLVSFVYDFINSRKAVTA